MSRFVPALVLCLVPLTALAAATHRETQTVEVVQVPVYVTSGSEPLRGLTRDQFELFVNGKRQAIDYFDVVDYATVSAESVPHPQTAAAAAPAPPPLQQRRLTVFVFDSVFTLPKFIRRSQKAAIDAIESASPADVFAVAVASPAKGLTILVPFTHDRVRLRSAIAGLNDRSNLDPLRLQVTADELAPVIGEDPRLNLLDEPREGVAKEQLDEPARRTAMTLMESLSVLALRLAPMQGVKHVVLLSSGFNAAMLHGIGPATTYAGQGLGQKPLKTATEMLVNGRFESAMKVGSANSSAVRSLKTLASSFTSAGVFLDSVNVAGVPEYTDLDPGRDESLFAMVEPTGGEVMHNDNDLRRAITHLSERQQVVYVLGFHARPTGRKVNAIAVKLRGVQASIRYRPSYTSEVGVVPAGDPLRLADILANDIPQTGVGILLSTRAANGRATVDAAVSAPELFAVTDARRVEADALVYVYSGQTVVASAAKKIDIDRSVAEAKLAGGSLHVVNDFDLPAGTYAAKVLLRLEGTDLMGFARRDFVVP